MDGFGTKEYVVIMGATNRPELLDKALTRPGRFDRNIEVTLPDLNARADIFKVHLKPLKLSSQFTMYHIIILSLSYHYTIIIILLSYHYHIIIIIILSYHYHIIIISLSYYPLREEYANRLATLTPGFSGAEIANLCNEAAILAGRNGHETVESIDFEMASERIIAGLEKKGTVNLE
jgi:AFG3 family protein